MQRLTITIVMALLMMLCGTVGAASKSGVDPQVISLPKGPGSIEGLGESFEPQMNTGTATYAVKIKVSPGVNKHQPEVTLNYNSGYGNSAVGIGWDLGMSYLQRQTDKGVPDYTDADRFIFSGGGELVPVGGGTYRMKIEGLFMKFVKHGDTWEAWQKNGTHLYFGMADDSRQGTPRGTFKWLLEKAVDANGNEIRYYYGKDGGQIYLSEIRYSIMSDTVYKSVSFVYENRPDIFTDFHSRARITTAKRLKSIEVRSAGALVRKYELAYRQEADFSMLAQVTQFGSDGTTALPPMTFDYSTYEPSAISTVSMSNPPPIGVSLTNGNVDLVDINGDSLPDLVFTEPGEGHRFFINRGRGEWDPSPAIPDASPQYSLAADGVMMSDMDGDGLADLFVKNSVDFGYYRNLGDLTWEESDWVPCSPQSDFSFENPNIRLLDVNNDKLIDVILDTGEDYQIWLNRKDNQWSAGFDYTTQLPNGSHLNFSSPFTKLGDMNGDRMEDLVYVVDGYVSYFPNKGNGEFDTEIVMVNPPAGLGESAEKPALADLNNDGLADAVLVGNGAITVWFNAGNNVFKDPLVFDGLPSYIAGTSAFRFADMDGDGFRDLLINDEGAYERYRYVSFNNGVHPNLLTKISNGLGMETTIDYRSSTDDYVIAWETGNPWATKVPFPVQVVNRVRVKDLNSGQEYVTDYSYRDGYYDGAEKQFRGFGSVDQLTNGEAGAPALLTRHAFDVGKEEESRKGLPLGLAVLEENGTVSPPVGLLEREENDIRTRDLLTGTNGERVRFSFVSANRREVYEKTDTPKFLLQEFDQDDFGNTIKEFNYGIVDGSDKSVGKDEVLTTTDYLLDETNWILDRPSQIEKTTLNGDFISTNKYFYDAKGNLARQEGTADGSNFIPLVRNQFDDYGNIIRITDANDHYRDIGYDTTFHTFPISETIGGLSLTLTADYDLGLGVITSYTDFNNNRTSYGYDPLGRLTTIIKPGDSEAYPTQQFVYTLANPVSSVLTNSRENVGQTGTYDSISYYDGLGRKLQTRSEGENDGTWVVTDAVVFNQQKGVKRKWLPYFGADSAYAVPPEANPFVELEYDAKGRSVKEINPDTSFRTSLYQPLVKVAHDEEDTATSGPHADTPHTYVNDGLDRLVKVWESNGSAVYVTKYEYDGQSNLTKVIDNEGNVRTMTFDGLSRKTTQNDPDRHLTTYGYDDVGNLLSTIDAKNQTVTYAYDPGNRIMTENFGGNTKVRYHYDSDLSPQYPGMANTMGKLGWVEDEAGNEFYSYDSRGNTVTRVREAGGMTFVNRMAYDSMDRLVSFTYPDNSIVTYQYNAMNQLEAIPGYVSDIDYEATGMKSRFAYANGIEGSYRYDTRQRLEGLKSVRGGTTLQDLSYGYDKVNNITAITDGRPVKSTEDLTRGYLYDDLYRLTRTTASSWNESYQYSSIGNMTFKSDVGAMTYGANGAGPHALTKAAGISTDYRYDANGNLAAKQPGFTYTFDHKDRLTAATRASDNGRITYSYDAGGNRVTKSVTVDGAAAVTVYADKYTEVRGRNLIKNIFAGNRLVARVYSMLPESGQLGRNVPLTIADFDRNHDGVISPDEIRGQGTDPATMENAEVADVLALYYANLETNPGLIGFETMATALHELGQAQMPGQKTYFYLPDHLGSASIVTDDNGNLLEESVYYPYGANRARTGAFESDYRFTGKELDDETGLHYFGARYYDSQTGRFVSVDPLLSLSSDNKEIDTFSEVYVYAGNNPLKYVDINGLEKNKNDLCQGIALGLDVWGRTEEAMSNPRFYFESARVAVAIASGPVGIGFYALDRIVDKTLLEGHGDSKYFVKSPILAQEINTNIIETAMSKNVKSIISFGKHFYTGAALSVSGFAIDVAGEKLEELGKKHFPVPYALSGKSAYQTLNPSTTFRKISSVAANSIINYVSENISGLMLEANYYLRLNGVIPSPK